MQELFSLHRNDNPCKMYVNHIWSVQQNDYCWFVDTGTELIFKIKNHMVPGYLSELFHQPQNNDIIMSWEGEIMLRLFAHIDNTFQVHSIHQLSRNGTNFHLLYKNSHSLNTFCRALKCHIKSTLKTPWYGQGDRFLDIQHTRIRLGCSKLKSHLYYNLFVEDNPHCMCGHIKWRSTTLFLPLSNV